MTMTTRQLIGEAYLLTNIIGDDIEGISDNDINIGLIRLNDFLAKLGAKDNLVQYATVYNGTFVPGDGEKFFIPNLISISTFTYTLTDTNTPSGNGVKIPLVNMSQYRYFGQARPTNVKTIPWAFHMERNLGGADVYLYFIPDKPYPFQIVGNFALQSTTLNQDLSTLYDPWYLLYLKYGLAIYICQARQTVPPASIVAEMRDIERAMTSLSPRDMTLRKSRYFSGKGGLTWADVSYRNVWRTG